MKRSTEHRPRWVSMAMAALVVATPLLYRAIILFEKRLAVDAQDLRGVFSDLAMGGVIAVLLLYLATRARVLAALLAGFWVVLNVSNYEHIRMFDAVLQPGQAEYLGDVTFLLGSALHFTHPVLLGLALLCVFASAKWWGGWTPPVKVTARAVPLLVFALVVSTAWPLHDRHLPWRQMHVLSLTAREALHQPAFAEVPTMRPERAAEVYARDLSGAPRIPLGEERRPNVLVVMVEGLSGGYIAQSARYHGVEVGVQTPNLEKLGERGLLFQSFLSHQRQTNRGLYSLLCGDLDKLVTDVARMTEYVPAGGAARRLCLPRLLKDAGYHTAYLQAAPLVFMAKDEFMSAAGFSEVLGTNAFERRYAETAWGIDDKAFFEQSAERLIQMDEAHDEPWFAALLTVGTHHPFTVPDDYRPDLTPHARAVAYADEALAGFIARLDEAGVLENTLVLLTSDESAGITVGDDLTRSLSQNWTPMVVFGPHIPKGTVPEIFAQPDVAVSVLDYLGLADETGSHLMGRSMFRRYEEARPFFFANTYLRRSYALEEDGVLSVCNEHLVGCRSYAVDLQKPFGPSREGMAWQRQRLPGWRGVRERAHAPWSSVGATAHAH